MTDIQKQKIKLLRSSGKSYRDIAAEMGLKESTVKTYCNRSGLTDKDISLIRSKQKNKCLYCGAEIYQISKQKPKKFCSDKCRFAWWNKNRELKIKRALCTIKCRGCGKTLIQKPKTKPRRFCSDRCRLQWWSKHPNSGNRSGFSFICEYCGKEFKSYASKTRRYCSTHCYAQARCESNEKEGEKLIAEKTPCGTEFSNLPADCQCTACKWFADGKRGCPCKKEIDKNM